MREQEAIEVLEKPSSHIHIVHKTKNGTEFLTYSSDLVNAFELAIASLEKQVAMKPIEYEDKYYGCKCGNVLMHKWKKYNTELMPKTEGWPYCLNCGQKLDWSDE